jgi:hypothetical protein
VHPSAWCKANQGWVTVKTIAANGAATLADVKTSHTILRLWKNGSAGNEYFFLENRQQAGFDASLPGDGLLIWHIDDAQSSNTNENHYKVALMQADGKRDLEHNANRGDAGDPYPGSSNNRSFNATSNPNSKSYAHSDSCVAVTGISASGASMGLQLQVKCPAGHQAPSAAAAQATTAAMAAAAFAQPTATATPRAKPKIKSRAKPKATAKKSKARSRSAPAQVSGRKTRR